MEKKKMTKMTITGIVLYLVATGISFAGFSLFGTKATAFVTKNLPGGTKATTTPSQGFVIDPSIPRTEECPINGLYYTEQERKTWEARRPLAVMIENHEESRPQSGLSYADVVYESVAEGGITRFMGVFYCGVAAQSVNLAPVRSARTYFLPWVLEYDAAYNHVGGAGRCNDDTVDERAKALCQIDQYKIKDMDQFGISFPTCYRNYDRLDHEVATEHTMVCVTDKLIKLAKDRGWTNVDENGVSWDKNFTKWKFADEADTKDRGTSTTISFVAWSGYEKSYGVKWEYDPAKNIYKRFNGGVAHIDHETKQQLAANNVVVMFAKETGPVDDHMHLLYNNIGSGDGILFQNGKVTKVTWKKPVRTSRTVFYDASTNKEVSLVRGQTWIEMLPIGTQVTY